ncbi:hypothetical protein PCASD_07872 [Puccinia coronata f. sp. avenae]|uniref:Tet-like 2OG-Fe(II) oxygenase domain-containing protein n=1 Tax=Puccinia coronata f. sp. avenae TaxID=200324 RepID=A0A2N5UQV2_9BASI|nr:hypothetical protein PCASD_07872 [Puccinia coronata f. sp. avenae]
MVCPSAPQHHHGEAVDITSKPGASEPRPKRRCRRARKRPNQNAKQMERRARKAMAPFVSSGSGDPSHLDPPTNQGLDSDYDSVANDTDLELDVEQSHDKEEKPHFYYVNPARQHDPLPHEPITKQEHLPLYHRLSFGTVIIAPRNRVAFCKAQWIPFNSMSPDQLNGWEKLVFHLLERCNHVSPVKTNGAQTGGMMWADGWRKSSDPDQSLGRFCCVGKMKKAMERAQYNPVSEAAGIREASDFISLQLQKFAPGVFESCRQLLIDSRFPSMAQMEYPSPYTSDDFASFLTFTMFNFYNQPHKDSDVNDWTLVIWIPIFNPQTRTEDDPVLADEGFDMMGGQFTFRDFQVYLDLQEWKVYSYWFFLPNV